MHNKTTMYILLIMLLLSLSMLIIVFSTAPPSYIPVSRDKITGEDAEVCVSLGDGEYYNLSNLGFTLKALRYTYTYPNFSLAGFYDSSIVISYSDGTIVKLWVSAQQVVTKFPEIVFGEGWYVSLIMIADGQTTYLYSEEFLVSDTKTLNVTLAVAGDRAYIGIYNTSNNKMISFGEADIPDLTQAITISAGGSIFNSINAEICLYRDMRGVTIPIPRFYPHIVVEGTPTAGYPVVFNASGTFVEAVNIIDILWDFNGDGVVDLENSALTATWTYEEPGEYTVNITFICEYELVYTYTMSVRVYEPAELVNTVNGSSIKMKIEPGSIAKTLNSLSSGNYTLKLPGEVVLDFTNNSISINGINLSISTSNPSLRPVIKYSGSSPLFILGEGGTSLSLANIVIEADLKPNTYLFESRSHMYVNTIVLKDAIIKINSSGTTGLLSPDQENLIVEIDNTMIMHHGKELSITTNRGSCRIELENTSIQSNGSIELENVILYTNISIRSSDLSRIYNASIHGGYINNIKGVELEGVRVNASIHSYHSDHIEFTALNNTSWQLKYYLSYNGDVNVSITVKHLNVSENYIASIQFINETAVKDISSIITISENHVYVKCHLTNDPNGILTVHFSELLKPGIVTTTTTKTQGSSTTTTTTTETTTSPTSTTTVTTSTQPLTTTTTGTTTSTTYHTPTGGLSSTMIIALVIIGIIAVIAVYLVIGRRS